MSKLSANERQRLKKMAARPDDGIDFSDIPELKALSPDAIVGKFYRPVKRKVTVRIDSDVLAWLKSEGDGYQTRMNEVLREKMKRTLARKRHR